MGIIQTVRLIYKYTYEDDEKESEEEKAAALKGIDLDIEKGQFVAVLGANGSGKSTLAKQFDALLTPTSGTVWIEGRDTAQEENLFPVRRSTGMIFQNPDNQIIGNVVEEDVGFGPENLGVPTEEIWERVDKSLAACGMEAYRYQSPNRLSGGQKQRVAIAGVMAMKPDCIVMDEPTAMLDPRGRREVLNTVHDLNREEGITVVLITHYMDEAVSADRVFVMSDGQIVMDGTPREIFSQPDLLKSYQMDVPQATELASLLQKDGVDLPTGILTPDEFVEEICRLKSDI